MLYYEATYLWLVALILSHLLARKDFQQQSGHFLPIKGNEEFNQILNSIIYNILWWSGIEVHPNLWLYWWMYFSIYSSLLCPCCLCLPITSVLYNVNHQKLFCGNTCFQTKLLINHSYQNDYHEVGFQWVNYIIIFLEICQYNSLESFQSFAISRITSCKTQAFMWWDDFLALQVKILCFSRPSICQFCRICLCHWPS